MTNQNDYASLTQAECERNERCRQLYFYFKHVKGYKRSLVKKLINKLEPPVENWSDPFADYNDIDNWNDIDSSTEMNWEDEYAQFVKEEDDYVKSQAETEMDCDCDIFLHDHYGYTRLYGHNPVHAMLDQDDLWDYLSSTMYNGHFQGEFVLNLKTRRSSNRFSHLNNGRSKRISGKLGGHSWRDKYASRCRHYDCSTSKFMAELGVKRQTATEAVTKEAAYLDYIDSQVDCEVAQSPSQNKVQTFTLTIPNNNGKGFSDCTCIYKPNHSFTMLG